MAAKTYGHSAYWYAYHKGWTYSEAKTLAGQYLDMHSYRPRNGGKGLLALGGGNGSHTQRQTQDQEQEYDFFHGWVPPYKIYTHHLGR